VVTDVFDPQPPTPRAIVSICRCSSHAEHASRAAQSAADSAQHAQERAAAQVRAATAELTARTPDPDRFHIEETEEVGAHLVLRVRYPNCVACAYEGLKTLVILNRSLKAAIRWKRIDPHFRDPAKQASPYEAPSPSARFPGSKEGWIDAVAYARGKAQ
jgi:hypothetical protein